MLSQFSPQWLCGNSNIWAHKVWFIMFISNPTPCAQGSSVTMHHVPNCISCHKAIVMITRGGGGYIVFMIAYIYNIYIYILYICTWAQPYIISPKYISCHRALVVISRKHYFRDYMYLCIYIYIYLYLSISISISISIYIYILCISQQNFQNIKENSDALKGLKKAKS